MIDERSKVMTGHVSPTRCLNHSLVLLETCIVCYLFPACSLLHHEGIDSQGLVIELYVFSNPEVDQYCLIGAEDVV